jgi:hypothetical protein
VLPVMMVIKRHEGHFYGIDHGELSIRWQAEGDRHFAETNCSTHPWYEEVVAHMAYSEDKVRDVDVMLDSDEVDLIIVGGMEHRAHLDVVHDRLGLPRLNGDAYDIADLEASLVEGERNRRAAGPSSLVLAEESRAGGYPSTTMTQATRCPITPQGRVALEPFQRILDSINMEPELLPDRKKLQQLLRANAEALRVWCRKNARMVGLMATTAGALQMKDIFPWLLQHRDELHRLFRYLPYPELEAKQLRSKLLMGWGNLEAYDVMVEEIRRVLHDPDSRPEAAEYCRQWLAACTLNAGDVTDRTVARERRRWAPLAQLCPTATDCSRPEGITPQCWSTLHTLPYTIWSWSATMMGMRPKALLGRSYHDHPAVRVLCEQVKRRRLCRAGSRGRTGSPQWREAFQPNPDTKGRKASTRSHQAQQPVGPRGPSHNGPHQRRQRAPPPTPRGSRDNGRSETSSQ